MSHHSPSGIEAAYPVPTVPLHEPVLAQEVLTHLELPDSSDVLDATLGLGGHAAAILARDTSARVIGFDADPGALRLARERLAEYGPRLETIHANFAEMAKRLPAGTKPAAILMDLGISSWQLAERGFSFQLDAPLDMRMNPDAGETAAELISRLTEADLADVIYRYGEERHSRRIARAIKGALREGAIDTTTALAEIIAKAAPRRGRLHPATKTFQALRIAVNDELGNLEKGLTAAETLLAPNGKLLVISFHSLEDRLVKRFINNSARLEKVNKKVITPSREEIKSNSRARSAKLRVARKVG